MIGGQVGSGPLGSDDSNVFRPLGPHSHRGNQPSPEDRTWASTC